MAYTLPVSKLKCGQCDELRPICTNCISRATDCQYATSGSFIWKYPSEVSASSSFPRTTRQLPNSAEGDVHCMSQIGSPQKTLQVTGIEQCDDQQSHLLSHWRASTYQAIARHGSVEWIWQHLVPEESLSHPYLLNGVLALSAIHLVTKTEDDPRRTALIKAAERYQGRAISMLAYVIGNLNPSNCNATFCLSSILVICAWGFPLIAHPTQDQSLDEIYQIFLLVRKMVHLTGIMTPWIQNGRLAPLISVPSLIPTLSNHSREVITSLSILNLEIQHLEGDVERQLFQYTIDGLETLFGTIDGGGEVVMAGSLWISYTPPRFFELVRELRPFALVILAHYCAIFHRIPEQWWISPWNQRVQAAIYSNLEEKWRGFIKFPTGLIP